MSQDRDQIITPTAPKTAPAAAKAVVFMVVFIDLLGFGIVLPLLPLFADGFVKDFFGADAKDWIEGLVLGLLMSSFSLMQFLFAPVWGRISDQIGRRPVLLIGLAGSVVFYSLFGYAAGLPHGSTAEGSSGQGSSGLALALLFLARLGAGVAGATISTAQAVIADTTPKESRKMGMALIGAAFGIGFTFGPLFGFGALLLFPAQVGSVGYVAAGLSFLALILGILRLPETRIPGTSNARRNWFDSKGFREVLATPGLGTVIFVSFLATLGFGAFESTLSLINEKILNLGKEANFLIFAYVGLVLTLANGAYRGFAKRMSEETAMAIGIVTMGLGVISLAGVHFLHGQLLPWSVLFALLLVSLTLSVIGFALLTPSAQGLISRRADPERQGEILGVNQSCLSMARILGPIMGLTLYKLAPMLPFVVGGILVLLMLPLVAIIRKSGNQ